jgi:hypothetical protein
MTRVRAFVVGIDKYDEPGWDVSGPVASAMLVADWLLGLENVELDLHLFLSKGTVLTSGIVSALESGRLTFHDGARHADIEAFVRLDLPTVTEDGAHLFAFWSGHGVTCPSTGDRVFMCSDFQEKLQQRVFNASAFLRRARTADYAAFRTEVMLADVCGVFRVRDQVLFEQLEQREQINVPQFSCFSGRQGNYASTAEGGGQFTVTALRILAGDDAYPVDLKELASRFDSAFDGPSHPAMRLLTSTDDASWEPSVGRCASHLASLPFFDSALALFRRLDVSDDDYRYHYGRTAVAMGFPTLPRESGAREVLAHLCDLRDGDIGHMPYGLVQFMLRLSQVTKYNEDITNWLSDEAPEQQSVRAKVRQLLDAEQQRKILLFVVGQNKGVIDSIQPFLCRIDGSLNPQHKFSSVVTPCKDWAAFEVVVQETLVEFRDGDSLPNLEVHFAVDPPLLDRPFHRVLLEEGGEPISALAPVILRHRTRLFTQDQDWLDKWTAYASMLRTKQHDDLRWVRVEPELPLPEVAGMCYTGFTLPHPAGAAASFEPQKRILNRLLSLGAPVIYVRHGAPMNECWDLVGAKLDQLTTGLSQFDSFTKVFHNDRVRGDVYAMEASLIWDDPETNPFTPTYGTSDD